MTFPPINILLILIILTILIDVLAVCYPCVTRVLGSVLGQPSLTLETLEISEPNDCAVVCWLAC